MDISPLKVRVVVDKIELDDDPKLANVLRTQQHVREIVGLANTLPCRNKLYQYSYMTVPNQNNLEENSFIEFQVLFRVRPSSNIPSQYCCRRYLTFDDSVEGFFDIFRVLSLKLQ